MIESSWVRSPRQRRPGPRVLPVLVPDNVATTAILLLVHGGLWENGMDADAFWRRLGVVARSNGCSAAVVVGSTVLAGSTEPPGQT